MRVHSDQLINPSRASRALALSAIVFGLILPLTLAPTAALAQRLSPLKPTTSGANAAVANAKTDPGLAFAVTMPDPANHTFHVTLHSTSLDAAASQEFLIPVWTPGYYGILGYAANVQNMKAADAAGKTLTVDGPTSSTWRIATGGARDYTLNYDVVAATSFVANSFLDATHGYIMPASLCVYPKDQIKHASTIDIEPAAPWKDVATGLDPLDASKPHNFYAPDFDILFDSPILIGNLEHLKPFEIAGIKHDFVGYNMGQFDRDAFMTDLQAVIKAGVDVIGDIPYTHYTFIAAGPGQGGIEHLNSTSFGFTTVDLTNLDARNRELSFLAHEYFHHYNVKRIRPILLGPFDYQHANLTNMLWVSEGFTVYYEYMMLGRSGMMDMDQLLAAFQKEIATLENGTGRLFQSATQASYDSWSQGPFGTGGRGGAGRGARGGRGGAGARRGNGATTGTQGGGQRGGRGAGAARGAAGAAGGARGAGADNAQTNEPGTPARIPLTRTVSYYNKGPIVGLLLDFKIRQDTKNAKSLDTVMQTLYKKYYQEQKRGWTDEEFRATCEQVSGSDLGEVFSYADSTAPLDYAKYLGYAGLKFEDATPQPFATLGFYTERRPGGGLFVAAVEPKGEAAKAGLKAGDEVRSINGTLVTSSMTDDPIDNVRSTARIGDELKLNVARNNASQDVAIKLVQAQKQTYKLMRVANPSDLQAAILEDWVNPNRK